MHPTRCASGPRNFNIWASKLSSFFLVLHDELRRGWLPPGKRAWGRLHRTATHVHLKESGAVLLVSRTPQRRQYSPSPAANLVAHISVLADTPAIGIDLSLKTLVHTPLQVHARYVTSRAINILHAGCRIRGNGAPPISLHKGISKSCRDRECPHRRLVKR